MHGVTDQVRGARVAVVGGSIAGCAAATAARRAGCDVTVFERSAGALAEQGFGLALPTAVRDELIKTGYMGPATPALPMRQRLWLTRDGDGGIRELWSQKLHLVTCNWGLLWRSLRAGVPGEHYRVARTITAVRRSGSDRALVTTRGGDDIEFDLVVGGDGHRSTVREEVEPNASPCGAPYVALRGILPLDRLSGTEAAELVRETVLTVLFDRGHLLAYLIPDGAGGSRVNWLLYVHPPDEVEVDLERGSLARGASAGELVEWAKSGAHDWLPEPFARVVADTPATATGVQPVFDRHLESQASAPFVLVGDAATLARPHTASGATKALQDALCLERVLSSHDSLARALAAFDGERREAGNDLVALGRRIGRDQVESTPDWSAMADGEMAGVVQATWSGQSHYLLPDND